MKSNVARRANQTFGKTKTPTLLLATVFFLTSVINILIKIYQEIGVRDFSN